jgi:single-strand DNA-binding protein
MANFNKVVLVGNLTAQPEVRFIPSGTAVCDAVLAVNERYKQADGSYKENVNFFDVTLWGRTAEIAGEFLSKGSPILIEGRLKQERWEKDGQKYSRVRVVCETMQMLGKTNKPATPIGKTSISTAEVDGNMEMTECPL